MTRYGMAIDTTRCVSCNRCALSCKVEHNLPNGVLWNRAHTSGGDFFMTPAADSNGYSMDFYTLACQHCENPACVDACPTGASVKREDGIVTVDYDECIGCQSCIKACPYENVRTLAASPEYALDFKTGDAAVPDIVPNTVSKCTFCVERIDRGEKPRCIDLCFVDARIFGDLDDPTSEISNVLASRSYEQISPEAGTGPSVFFLR